MVFTFECSLLSSAAAWRRPVDPEPSEDELSHSTLLLWRRRGAVVGFFVTRRLPVFRKCG